MQLSTVWIVCIDTNINEFIKQNHEGSHSFRTLSIPLALQKLFGIYYFATCVMYSNFKFSEMSTACYDLLNTKCFSTQDLIFYSSGGDASRMEKLKLISDYPITYDFLNVCVKEASNCSVCEKCKRTMLGLYSLNAPDKYRNVFDVDYFYKHKNQYLSDVFANKKNADWHEIYLLLKEQKSFSVMNYIVGFFKYLIRICKKIIKTFIKK